MILGLLKNKQAKATLKGFSRRARRRAHEYDGRIAD